jgi:hypothetical protein
MNRLKPRLIGMQIQLKLPLFSLVIVHSFAVLAEENKNSGAMCIRQTRLEAIDRLPAPMR